MENQSDAQAVIDAVKGLHNVEYRTVTDPDTGTEAPIIFRPAGMVGYDPKALLDQWLNAPRRIAGTAKAETQKSFCDLTKQHKTLNTVIFASIEKNQLVTVVDYHGKGNLGSGSTPSFCQHRIEYKFPTSPEFAAWKDAGKFCGQNAFAQFLDLHRFELMDPLDVIDIPEGSIMYDVLLRSVARDKRNDLYGQKSNVFASPSDLMQLVESLSGHSKTKFAEVKTDRFGGMKATIEKEGRIEGDEKIPSLFLVQVAAFVGGDKLVLPARIRAKVEANGLQLCAELVGVERVLGVAFAQAVEEVHADTGCEVFRGMPEA